MTEGLSNFLEVFSDVNKTAILIILLVIGCVFRIKGYIDGPGFIDLSKTTTISFFGTTTVVHFTSMIKDVIADKAKGSISKIEEIHNES